MKRLFVQLFKFGLAGGITTVIDFAVFALLNIFGMKYIISNICSYLCAIFANYWMSMNFVFVRKEDWTRKKEFLIFVVLSIIGLFFNVFFLWLFYDVLYKNAVVEVQYANDNGKMVCKIGATVLLQIFNFCSRKIVLEKRKDV